MLRQNVDIRSDKNNFTQRKFLRKPNCSKNNYQGQIPSQKKAYFIRQMNCHMMLLDCCLIIRISI